MQELGPYRLVELLGRGGMGEVWRALDTTHDDRLVALKVLGRWLDHDTRFAHRFHRESALAAKLGSPHVVPIHRYGEIDGRLFLDMQFVDGVDLGALIEREGPLPPARAVGIVGQIADGLDAAHRAGLVHRDVKPSNVLLTTTSSGTDHVYVIDFGIARAVDSSTASNDVIGTLAYMAPERFQGDGDLRCDVYALGCVLYEALTGVAPFGPGDAVTMMRKHLEEPPPRPSTVRDMLPREVDEVIARALAKRPDDRFPSAPSLAAAARAALESKATVTLGTSTRPAPLSAHPRPDAPRPDGPRYDERPSGSPHPFVGMPPGAPPPTLVGPSQGPPPDPPSTARNHRWRRPVLIGVVALVLAAGVAVPILLSRGPGGSPGTPTSTSAPTSAVDSPSTGTVAPTSAAAVTPQLDARHRALFDDLVDDGGVRWSTCVPLTSSENTDVPTAIACNTTDPELDRKVGFYRLASAAVYESRLAAYRGAVKRSGRCRDGFESAGDWTHDNERRGYIACLDSKTNSGFIVQWASRDALIEGRVQDTDAKVAYNWWYEHASSLPDRL